MAPGASLNDWGKQASVDAMSEGMLYGRWWSEKLWTMVPAVAFVGQFLQTFEAFPPGPLNGSIGVEQALRALEAGSQRP